ncbi:hypothetical protein QYE76_040117 [Lolium multiflorum]|uniref:Ribonuclease H1 N-terminal domain-containing protein n=1 Tax=Lolium multiflorum TaxID=4521 RepID=A0AAD8TAZ7_LOLMU|nr:hypothetical protein QYE76_040117 [Lolium multiflorum]
MPSYIPGVLSPSTFGFYNDVPSATPVCVTPNLSPRYEDALPHGSFNPNTMFYSPTGPLEFDGASVEEEEEVEEEEGDGVEEGVEDDEDEEGGDEEDDEGAGEDADDLVEVDADGVKKKKKVSGTRGPKWKVLEDQCLCESWATVSHDSIIGANQKYGKYWTRIKAEFDERKLIKSEYNKFNKAMDLYRRNSDGHKSFALMHCYTKLKKNHKWRLTRVSLSKGKDAIDLDAPLATSAGRPIGNKAAKAALADAADKDHPKDAEFLNVPIANYNEMHTIFSVGLATGKYAMGSSEPLGSAAPSPAPEDADTQESDTVNLDADKPDDAPEKPTAGKRKRGAFADDELVAFTNMTVAVKEVAQAISANKPTDMHPDLYNAVMYMFGFTEDDVMVADTSPTFHVGAESLVLRRITFRHHQPSTCFLVPPVALSHLVDHKAQGSSFVGMIEPHRILWLRNYLGKYHGKWYVVFRGRVRGIYSSWRVGQDQVNGYSNNSYRGYATLEEAHQEYLSFLEEELQEDHAIDKEVPLAQLPPEEVHALQAAPPEVRPSRVKDYIIAFLIVVIVRILFF